MIMALPKSSPPGNLTPDLWHLAFVRLLQERAPTNFEVQSYVPPEPPQADLLLLRRPDDIRQEATTQEQHRLRPWLARVTLVTIKSPRSLRRSTGLVQLSCAGAFYQADHMDDLPDRGDLALVLVVPDFTPTLLEEIHSMEWTRVPLGGGYSRIDGGLHAMFVAAIDEMTPAEQGDLLRVLSHPAEINPAMTGGSRSWTKETTVNEDTRDIPDGDELHEMPLDFLAPEELLAGLTPEERLAGLAPEKVVLALPLEILRALSPDYVRSLPPKIQQAVRRRIASSNG